jgi:glycosyltransferase involved in cell wall biosynthesis
MKTEVQRLFGVDSVVFPLGVDLVRFSPDVSRKLEENSLHDGFTLLYVGRLVPHKRVDFIIRAIAMLKDPSVNLFIVGSGPERHKLENLVKSLSLADYVFFIGAISDEELPYFYGASDAFVTASLHEGVCVPILEAFATGKPAIVPDNTAMPETIENGGLVYASDSVRDLADKIKLLKNDEYLRSNLKKNALAIAAKRSIGKTLVMYDSFLKEIMKN